MSILWTLVALTGCTPAAPTSGVEGRVVLDGAPLDEAVIVFVPLERDGGRKALASVRNGAYRLPADLGLRPGKYRVELDDDPPIDPRTGRPAGPARARRAFPYRYAQRSPLEIEIRADEPQAVRDFQLTSRP